MFRPKTATTYAMDNSGWMIMPDVNGVRFAPCDPALQTHRIVVRNGNVTVVDKYASERESLFNIRKHVKISS